MSSLYLFQHKTGVRPAVGHPKAAQSSSARIHEWEEAEASEVKGDTCRDPVGLGTGLRGLPMRVIELLTTSLEQIFFW